MYPNIWMVKPGIYNNNITITQYFENPNILEHDSQKIRSKSRSSTLPIDIYSAPTVYIHLLKISHTSFRSIKNLHVLPCLHIEGETNLKNSMLNQVLNSRTCFTVCWTQLKGPGVEPVHSDVLVTWRDVDT